jgi:phospholipase D1/2
MNAPEITSRSARSIQSLDGTPLTTTITSNIHIGDSPFAIPRDNNKVKAFTTGKAYFSDLLNAIRSASETIYIAGWQVNWDAQLDEQGARLFDVLLHAVTNNKNLKIYVMPWDDTAPIQTFDDQTKAALEIINEIVGRPCVFVVLANAKPDEFSVFYSHHQKQVVIDEKIAYVGGMDLCYGRFDDEHFDLRANAKGRAALNRYNGCVYPTGELKQNEVANPDLLNGIYDSHISNNKKNTIAAIKKTGKDKVHQVPYVDDAIYSKNEHLDEKFVTLNHLTQPRMPWQDSHVKIVGPAAYDLARNFVIRWNSSEKTAGDKPKLKLPPTPPSVCTGTGCIVQVLRSAPRAMLDHEHEFTPPQKGEAYKPITGEQHNIADAMATLIEKSQHFIYIENQFFVSAFGQEGELDSPGFSGPAKEIKDKESTAIFGSRTQSMYDNDQQPKNKICELLANRIDIEIKKGQKTPFHIYITLPVHPEGMLNNGTVMTQVHWTMQSLVFGSHSLLNRIRRSLYAKTLGKDKWDTAFDPKDEGYKTIKIEECEQYVTLLNLRNWENLAIDNAPPRYVTEQIYIHNKLMIVDDRYVLVGSANINDRSLLGTRDSELNVLITDTKTEKVDLCGDGKQRFVRSFAREMRMEVWNKIFGITSGKRAATELAEAVEKPGSPKSWEAIRKVAAKNTALYEAAFDFIPRNEDRKAKPINGIFPSASIWPRWHAPAEKNKPWTQSGPMPFDENFWIKAPFNPNEAFKREEVKGFITLLPIGWTKGNKNNLGYASPLLVQVPTKTRNA